jgi:lysozyme family protein
MADITMALNNALIYEGGYVNDPDDPGGETCCGISRRYFPDWTGWEHLDKQPNKQHVNLPTVSIELFYRANFWNRFLGDQIAVQTIADELLECAINVGVHQAVKFLQTALNVLNRQGTLYQDVAVDGELGPVTLGIVNWYAGKKDISALIKTMNILQGAYYIDKMQESDIKEKFARGWLNRVEI